MLRRIDVFITTVIGSHDNDEDDDDDDDKGNGDVSIL